MFDCMEKKLPLASSPILVYVDYSYPLSILRNYSQTDAWFYSNYIQLFFQKKDSNFRGILKFYITDAFGRIWYPFLPWFHYQTFQRDIIKALNVDIIELLINGIDKSYYTMLNWDEFYAPQGLTQSKIHFSHKTLIYGYDLKEECFYSVGFKMTTKYEHCKISFKDFKSAFFSEINDINMPYHDSEICLMRFNKNYSFNFDVDTFIQQLYDYYLSRNPLKNFRTHFNCGYDFDYFNDTNIFFGMNIYDYLKSYIELTPLHKNDYYRPVDTLWAHAYSNFQPFQALWEHKKLMVDRIAYLKKLRYLDSGSSIDDQFKQIQESSKQLRNLFIRYETTENEFFISEMPAILKDIYINEKYALEQLMEELQRG